MDPFQFSRPEPTAVPNRSGGNTVATGPEPTVAPGPAADSGTAPPTRRSRREARPTADDPVGTPGDTSTSAASTGAASTGSLAPPSSAGRNLPAAIGVGLGLGVVVVGSLFVRREGFVLLAAVAVLVAIWELSNAFRARRIRIPLVPTVVGGVGILVSAYASGADALFVSYALTCTAILWWRVLEGGDAVRDVTAGIFTAAYVPYLAGFAILMLAEPDGPLRVMTYLIVTIASDVGGYLCGSVWGRHAFAPTVSPHKTWEGLAGSAVLASIAGAVAVTTLLGTPWWVGIILGVAVTAAATVGDLSESLLKRDLGIKDMGSLLPGHGGVMDRLDSLLPAAPVAYVLLLIFV